MRLHLHVCERCGHTVDFADSTPGRGCFGRYREGSHPRSKRVELVLDVELDDPELLDVRKPAV